MYEEFTFNAQVTNENLQASLESYQSQFDEDSEA